MTKQEIKISPGLQSWLKENHILTKFMNNVKAQPGYFKWDTGKDVIDNILSAFFWDNTPEGYSFWSTQAVRYVYTLN